ncbi:MAG TPA: sulfotransferase [Ktedonobacteraceae bacterium]|nr:sulfotransferase [Ktedonobacteraceae bacterium]
MGEQQGTGGLKIIGAGFGRTGTLSLKAALEELGFGPCYHMVEVLKNPANLPYWTAAVQGEAVNWDEVFQGYQATVDWPACSFYRELMVAYPEAKVLLSVRDPEKWYESVANTIYKMGTASEEARRAAMEKILPQGGGGLPPTDVDMQQMRTLIGFIWGTVFHGKFEDRAHAIQVFNQHIEQVKRDVPPEKLLVYDVREGWEPLCAFLGVAVPANPFPALNSRENFQALNS